MSFTPPVGSNPTTSSYDLNPLHYRPIAYIPRACAWAVSSISKAPAPVQAPVVEQGLVAKAFAKVKAVAQWPFVMAWKVVLAVKNFILSILSSILSSFAKLFGLTDENRMKRDLADIIAGTFTAQSARARIALLPQADQTALYVAEGKRQAGLMGRMNHWGQSYDVRGKAAVANDDKVAINAYKFYLQAHMPAAKPAAPAPAAN